MPPDLSAIRCNVQVAVCKTRSPRTETSEVYDVLLTAMGKRRHPLLLTISTATGNSAGIGKPRPDRAGPPPRHFRGR